MKNVSSIIQQRAQTGRRINSSCSASNLWLENLSFSLASDVKVEFRIRSKISPLGVLFDGASRWRAVHAVRDELKRNCAQ